MNEWQSHEFFHLRLKEGCDGLVAVATVGLPVDHGFYYFEDDGLVWEVGDTEGAVLLDPFDGEPLDGVELLWAGLFWFPPLPKLFQKLFQSSIKSSCDLYTLIFKAWAEKIVMAARTVSNFIVIL